MPRLPIDYSKTIIYKICCNDVNISDIYIGHTTDLTRRKSQHKESCINESRKEYNTYKYKFIRETGGWDNWSVIPIEEFSCENVNQARIRERYWIETLKVSLNSDIPSRTHKEYLYDNKEKIKKYKKEYCENNKERIKEYDKEYYENNKEKKLEYHKEWCEENKEHLKDYIKEYYENNKTKILKKQKEKFSCECGGKYSHINKSHHFKTKNHQHYLTVQLSTQTISI